MDASSLTLYWASRTYFMISPCGDVGVPSLPAVERSPTGLVSESENVDCFGMVALMRGANHAKTEALAAAGEEDACDRKAMTELVSGVLLERVAGRAVPGCPADSGTGWNPL